jgi:hypothetical protein
METTNNISVEFLVSRLESSHKKFYELLKQRDALEIFHQKCNKFISEELKLQIDKMPKKSRLGDGQQLNHFEEIKVKLLTKAIKRLKPFFHTV